MFSWINSLLDSFKAFCQQVLNVLAAMLPRGALWNILALALFVVVMAATLYGLVRFLRKLHSGMYVRQVTSPFTISHILLGAALGIAGVVNPSDEKWKMILVGFFASWTVLVLLLMVKRMSGFVDPPHGKLLYLAIGIAYCAELMAVGLLALLVVYVAVALVIILSVGLGVASGGARSMFSGSSGGCGGSRREATLDDGTRLVEEGISWRECGGFDTYRQNMDGTFSRNS